MLMLGHLSPYTIENIFNILNIIKKKEMISSLAFFFGLLIFIHVHVLYMHNNQRVGRAMSNKDWVSTYYSMQGVIQHDIK